jgi:hypothetical protein
MPCHGWKKIKGVASWGRCAYGCYGHAIQFTSGYLNCLLRKELVKLFLKGNTLAQKHYLRFFGNRVIRIFGLDSWRRRNFLPSRDFLY